MDDPLASYSPRWLIDLEFSSTKNISSEDIYYEEEEE